MTRFYRFISITGKEVCINPKYIVSIERNEDRCHIYTNLQCFTLKADINILCDAIEMTANNKIDYGK
jgi:hypothetical protein